MKEAHGGILLLDLLELLALEGGGGIGLEKPALEYGEEGIYARVATVETAHLDEVRAMLSDDGLIPG